ncbi:MAG: amidophosphoribosyltransferase [Oscillospiraceae bacterium]|nr:amidophosphoribosyltransferase [Oscillospiraceae bacterium]
MVLDKVHEECGVFGIYSNKCTDVCNDTYLALYALQHRGQASCGIAVNDDGVITAHKDVGLVNEVLTADVLAKLGQGNMAVGHVRYSTAKTHEKCDAQPLVISHVKGQMVVAHNGSLVNYNELREEFELGGAIFQTTSDTEVIAYAITRERLKCGSIEDAVVRAMPKLKGAYSVVIMTSRKLVAFRDPIGFHPLCIGKQGDDILFASESCAFDSMGAKFVRDIEPGEVVVVEDGEIKSIKTNCPKDKGHICVFEYIYFARPDSVVEGASVHEARLRAGQFLAQEHPVEADVVIGVPDSGLDAALGYSRESGIPYGIGFIKNKYIGRTFIQPSQKERESLVRIKLNIIENTVKGKRVVMVDDSIVRGTTSARIVKLLREAGATEVHMRVSAPPFMHPCYFGTDIDSRDKLIACRMNHEEMTKSIGVDSLGFLSIDNAHKIAKGANCKFCDGCFSGKYPIEVPNEDPKPSFKFFKKLSQR